MRRARFVTTSALLFLLASSGAVQAQQQQQVRATPAVSAQRPIEVLHIPELESGFHLLYELKPAEARTQFET